MSNELGSSSLEAELMLRSVLKVAEIVAAQLGKPPCPSADGCEKHESENMQYGRGAHLPTRDQER